MSGKFANARDLRDPVALPRLLRKIAEHIPMGPDSRDEIEHAADELEKLQKQHSI